LIDRMSLFEPQCGHLDKSLPIIFCSSSGVDIFATIIIGVLVSFLQIFILVVLLRLPNKP